MVFQEGAKRIFAATGTLSLPAFLLRSLCVSCAICGIARRFFLTACFFLYSFVLRFGRCLWRLERQGHILILDSDFTARTGVGICKGFVRRRGRPAKHGQEHIENKKRDGYVVE